MPTTLMEPITDMPPQAPVEEHFRPLYIRRVPEQVWILVHDNANRSRMRLSDYLVKIMEASQPIAR